MSDTKNPSPPPLRAADKIRRTARELFYREGIRAVGVDEIVAQAGVTKPSLYRTYRSKDELTAAVLMESAESFWSYFDAAVGAHPGDPRAQLMAFFEALSKRSSREDYRGCPLTNALVEYPRRDHPARITSQDHKDDLRRRLKAMALEMGADEALGDALLLLVEGVYVTSQAFDGDRPSAQAAAAAAALIAAYTSR